ncbi:NusA-like transcription termination signal-binding factor [Candidatus Woesearchaeota archaeon CG10_big_fil_rev_8_21_14_0_10_34_8]|nr:MAG: NusA-like transcription termination signal-binding factor [Candidatus Woesearchaeota archaeon CG10_big_fil_rev_8_21_14_0_10_34_8]
MVKIRYTNELMGVMSLFNKITRVSAKDCFEDKLGLLTFVVDQVLIGKAVGKKATNVKKLEQLLKRKLRIIGYTSEVKQFLRNVIYPLKVSSIEQADEVLTIKDDDKKTKSLLIGRNAQNLRNTESIVNRYFSHITEIKVE